MGRKSSNLLEGESTEPKHCTKGKHDKPRIEGSAYVRGSKDKLTPAYWRRREKTWRDQGIIGFTREDYWRMEKEQNGRCASCGREPTQAVKPRIRPWLVVDHDKKTGKPRRLVCDFCNYRILGPLEKWRKYFDAALRYLSDPAALELWPDEKRET